MVVQWLANHVFVSEWKKDWKRLESIATFADAEQHFQAVMGRARVAQKRLGPASERSTVWFPFALNGGILTFIIYFYHFYFIPYQFSQKNMERYACRLCGNAYGNHGQAVNPIPY
eukprot:Filipodium_phascolosomae@DN8392_c0_g1_i1.p1